MLDLPSTTVFGRRIPKQKFYENLSVTPTLRRVFIDQISTVIWQNKIAASTANITQGENVTELEVFEIRLSAPELDQSVLQLIDREIPYHILFVLTHEGQAQAWIGYKEAAQSGTNAFKVSAYYHTPWMAEDQLSLRMEGTTTDAIYENFVRQIAGDALRPAGSEQTVSLGQAVADAQQREKLQKQIDALQKKVDKERQFNRRIELNAQLKQLKKELEDIT